MPKHAMLFALSLSFSAFSVFILLYCWFLECCWRQYKVKGSHCNCYVLLPIMARRARWKTLQATAWKVALCKKPHFGVTEVGSTLIWRLCNGGTSVCEFSCVAFRDTLMRRGAFPWDIADLWVCACFQLPAFIFKQTQRSLGGSL